MKKLQLSTILFFVSMLSILAQNEGNIWYFGYNAGINFNTTTPTALTNGSINQWEGCATICDGSGNLKFYTNGMTVWDRGHAAMPNGTGLLGHNSSSQSGVIVPKPGNPKIYYVFTVDQLAGANGLRYSEVDLTLKGNGTTSSPKGNVTSNKNIALATPVVEKITAVRHSNNADIWVIAHGWNNNTFYVYKITCAGVNTTPITINVGSVHNHVIGADKTGSIGCMKASPNGSKLALAIYTQSTTAAAHFELFDFNNTTGAITNAISIPNPSSTSIALEGGLYLYRPYGIEFSANGQLLYGGLSTTGEIFQWDLSSGSTSTILASKTLIGTVNNTAIPYTISSSLKDPNEIGQLQLAPNGKIYITANRNYFLSTINNPNTVGTGAGFTQNAFTTAGKQVGMGLPTFIQSFFKTPTTNFTMTQLCEDSPTNFNVTNTANIDSVRWYYGDSPTSTGTGFSTTHTYTTAGTYTVKMIFHFQCFSDTTTSTVTIKALPNATISNNGPYCKNIGNVTLTAATTGGTWSGSGVSGNIFNPSSLSAPATYTLNYTVTSNGCTSNASKAIVVNPAPNPNFANVGPLCKNSPAVSLSPSTSGGVFSGTGVVGSTFNPATATTGANSVKHVISNSYGCKDSSTKNITVNAIPNANFSVPAVCTNASPFTLTATTPGGTFSGAGVSGNVFTPSSAGSGSHVITYSITDGNSCANTSTASAVVSSFLSSAFSGPGVLCSSVSNYTLTPALNGGIFSGTGVSANGVFTPISGAGVYSITYSIAGTCGSTTTQTILVQQTVPATITSTSATLCANSSPFNLTSVNSGGTWSGTGVSGTVFNPQISGPGSFVIKYKLSGNCPDSSITTFTVNPVPTTPTALGDSSCNGNSLLLVAGGSNGIYNWYSDAALTNLVQANSSNFNPSMGGAPSGTYTFYLQAQLNGCVSNAVPVTAKIYSLNALAIADTTIGYPILDVNFTSLSSGINANDTYLWSFADGTTASTSNSQHSFEVPGVYTVSLTVTNPQEGCSATDTINITVLEEFGIDIPNVFTPNGDGTNDKFTIKSYGIKNMEGWIYDRWGLMLYKWEDASKANWDGKAPNGELSTNGTYYYLINAYSYQGKKKEYKGHVTIFSK